MSIPEIAAELSETAYNGHKNSIQLPELTREEAAKHIKLDLVNTERNEQLIKNVPHMEIVDLSEIPRWYLTDEASFIVNNDICERLQCTP